MAVAESHVSEEAAGPARTPLDIFEGTHRLRLLPQLLIQLVKIKQGRKRVPEPIILNTFKKEMFGRAFADFMHRTMIDSKHFSRVETEMFAGFTATRLNCVF